METTSITTDARKLVADATEFKRLQKSAIAVTSPREGDPPDILDTKKNLAAILERQLRYKHAFLLMQMADVARGIRNAIDTSHRRKELIEERRTVITRTDAHGNTMSIDKIVEVGTVLHEIAQRVEQTA